MKDEELDKKFEESRTSLPEGKTSPELAFQKAKERANQPHSHPRKVWKPILTALGAAASLSLCFYGGMQAGHSSAVSNTLITTDSLPKAQDTYLHLVSDYFEEVYPSVIYSSALDNVDGTPMMVNLFYGYDAEGSPRLAYLGLSYEYFRGPLRFYLNGEEVETHCHQDKYDGTGSFLSGNGEVLLKIENVYDGTVYSQDEIQLDLSRYDAYLQAYQGEKSK